MGWLNKIKEFLGIQEGNNHRFDPGNPMYDEIKQILEKYFKGKNGEDLDIDFVANIEVVNWKLKSEGPSLERSGDVSRESQSQGE